MENDELKVEFEGMIPDTKTACTLLGICPCVKIEGLVSEKHKFSTLQALAGVRLKVTVEVIRE